MQFSPQLELKYASAPLAMSDDSTIAGYASRFDEVDQGGDQVMKGAYSAALARLQSEGRQVKMLWQHDPAQPIGVWDQIHEDNTGLYVSGRILTETRQGAEAAALITAGALDGLSIGYRTVKSSRGPDGARQLQELDLWEVSLVTFPMLPTARVGATKTSQTLAQALRRATQKLKHEETTA